MKRIMLTVAYDGTGYSGFQVQDNAPTIEGELYPRIRPASPDYFYFLLKQFPKAPVQFTLDRKSVV